jgi:hypothetical protein
MPSDNSVTALDTTTDRLLAEWRRELVLVPRYERWHRTVCLISNLLHSLAVVEDWEAGR